MKKLLSVFIVATLLFSLLGCSAEDGISDDSSQAAENDGVDDEVIILDEGYVDSAVYSTWEDGIVDGRPTLEKMCSTEGIFLCELTVTGGIFEYERVPLAAEDYDGIINGLESKGFAQSDNDKEKLKEYIESGAAEYRLVPVEFGQVYFSNGDVEPALQEGKLLFLDQWTDVPLSEGQKYLVFGWQMNIRSPLDAPLIYEYAFKIDSENKLDPYFNVFTTSDYAGYTVEEFIEELRPYFEGYPPTAEEILSSERYIRTRHYDPWANISGYPTMEDICTSGEYFLAEFTVTGEFSLYERTYFYKKEYEKEQEYNESNGIVIDEDELEEYKKRWFTHNFTYALLPVEFGQVYLTGDDVTLNFENKNVDVSYDITKISRDFPVGARFLVLSKSSYLDPPVDCHPVTEYIFYIDSENKLTPVYDIPTTADYAGYTVEEFVAAVRPYFEAE